MKVACKLLIALAVDECAVFLRKRLSIDNAASLLAFTTSIKCFKLTDAVLRFVDKNFVPVSLTPEFCELPFPDLCLIIMRDSLNVDCESQV
ncbi:hypothetical protein PMAYCL1PPCAC_13849, partial [Pristionchus mayeri]